VKVCIVTELHAFPRVGLMGHQDKRDCQFIKWDTMAISLLKGKLTQSTMAAYPA